MELIGTHWGSFNGQNISLFEPVSDIKRFLKTISTLLW